MLNSKTFLAVDFGAGSLKLAEFEVNEAGGLRLKQYGFESLGAEGSQETAREAIVLKALQKLLAEKGIKSRTVNVCAPGFHVFSKFVKLPPVDAGKVTQIIQYEAQQNVPFPLEEVVWDYQILGSTAAGELEVLLVAIKADIVEGLFRTTEAVGLRLQLCDVSPAALCNAFRYNYGCFSKKAKSFPAASTWAPTQSRRISPANPKRNSTPRKRSKLLKASSVSGARMKSLRTRTRPPSQKSRGNS